MRSGSCMSIPGRSIGLRAGLPIALALCLAGPVHAQMVEPAGQDTPAPLDERLRDLADRSGQSILYREEDVSGHVAGRAIVTSDMDLALAGLLEGTGLEAVETGAQTYVIRVRRESGASSAPMPEDLPPVETRPVQNPVAAPSEEDQLLVEQVVVTGTSLRGLAPETSPLQIYDRDDVLGSGASTLDQFVRALPQNFGGGSSEFTAVGLPNDANSRANNTSGASANLRGLGSRGTLVLLNGTRLAPTSEIGDFVDLSLIPVSALDRVEVLTDGASSIYGGDAVAGVINFILRKDFEGAETTLRYGAVTSGGLRDLRFSQTLGESWQSGHVLGVYEYFDRTHLTLADRPGISLFDASGPDMSLPDPAMFDLLPDQTRHSLVLSGGQDLTSRISLDASLLHSERTTDRSQFGRTGTVEESGSRSRSTSLALGADWDLAKTWLITLKATYSELDNRDRRREVLRSDDLALSDMRIATGSTVWAVEGVLSGDLIRMPSGPVRLAFGTQYREEDFSNEIRGDRVSAEGRRDVSAVFGEIQVPLVGDEIARPGLQRLDLNLSGRVDEYSDYGRSATPKIGLLWQPADGVKLRASWSESFAPPALGRAFSTSRTGQVFPYQFLLDLFGLDAPDPGLADLDYLQVLGTSGDLEPETSRTFTAGFDADIQRGRHDWRISGSWYDIAFEDRLGTTPVPGGLLDFQAPGIAWNDPSAFPEGSVIFYPDRAEIDRLVASFQRPVGIFMGSSLDTVGIINNVNVVRNLARTETRGLDLQIDYRTRTDWGDISAGLNLNHILDFTQQASVSTPAVSTLDTYLNPVDLQVRGQLGWQSGNWQAALTVNHADSYRVNLTEAAAGIDAWTTTDLTLSRRFGPGAGSWLKSTELNLSILNLFDAPPPATPSDGVYGLAGYDPTNASPLERYVGLEVRSSF